MYEVVQERNRQRIPASAIAVDQTGGAQQREYLAQGALRKRSLELLRCAHYVLHAERVSGILQTGNHVQQVTLPLCGPLPCSKRIFEITISLPRRPARQPKKRNSKTKRRPSSIQPRRHDDTTASPTLSMEPVCQPGEQSAHGTPVGKNTPHTRAIGGTFEFTFSLPKPANTRGGRPNPQPSAPQSRKANSSAPTANHQAEVTETDNEKYGVTSPKLTRQEYERARAQQPERIEYHRRRMNETRKNRIARGLCVDCGKSPPKPNQTRCQTCAVKHQGYTKVATAKRKTAAEQAAPIE